MNHFLRNKKLRNISLLFILLLLPFILIVVKEQQNTRNNAQTNSVSPLTLISRGVPAFSSSGVASSGNDTTFDTQWRSSGTPAWLAYDLSHIPVSQRNNVLLVWYNETNSYDHNLINETAYNMPGSYTIDINTAPGGSNPPTSGWQTVAIVDNHYHSRQHVFAMNGANWVRLNATSSDGSPQNMDVNINMDVYDASQGTNDDFIDYGDSISAAAMGHGTVNGTKSVGDLVHVQLPNHFPVVENGGTGYLTSADGVKNMSRWVSSFPGKFIGLSFGTNDSWGCGAGAATTVYNNYISMIQTILAAGKIPIITRMPWSTHTDLQTCAQSINVKLNQLPSVYPQSILGPDLYTVLQNHPEYFADGIHPNAAGSAVYRQAWANTILNIYNGNIPNTTATPTINVTPTSGVPPAQFSGLHVSGNTIVNQQGQQVILRGIDRAGTEYMCIQGNGIFDGPSDAASIQAMKSWGINAILIPINEDCWVGINGANPGGATYQQAISNYVKLVESYDIYPMIVYMWAAPGTQQAKGHPAMPDADHAPATWTSLANTFKGDNAVILKLQEEPHLNEGTSTAAWQCWKNGGSSCNEGYTAVGFQSLVNTVRATGAQNIIALPGLAWSNVMDQFLTYKPTDPLNNMMATVDVYPTGNGCGDVNCYNSQYAPVIGQMPFMAGEFGESVNGNVCGVTGSNAFMNWLDQHNSGYLAWTWDTWGTSCGDLSLITNYNGTPHFPNGTNFKAHLLSLNGRITLTPTINGNPTPLNTPTPTTTPAGSGSPTPTVPSNPTITNNPTPTVSTDILLNLTITLPSIGSITQGNIHPLHPLRHIKLTLYNVVTQQIYPFDITMVFNGNYFSNPSIDVGQLPAGQYQIFLKTNSFLQLRLINTDGTNTFSFVSGTTLTLPPNDMIGGDISPISQGGIIGDNTLDLSDYNLLISCYGSKIFSISCTNKIAADLDDNGAVDGIDYNIFLRGLAQTQNGDSIPGQNVIPTISISSSPTQ